MVTRRRILIVDEEAASAAELRTMAVGLGHEVVALGDGATATGAPARADVVLIALPEIDPGSVVAKADDARRKYAPAVIFVVDAAGECVLDEASGNPAAGCLVRPFSPRELHTTIELAVCRSDATRSLVDLDNRFFAVAIDMLCFLGFNGYFARLNPAWERTLGFSPEELMSRPFIEFVHPDDRERTLHQNRAVRSGGQAIAFENRYRCKDGSYRWFRWNAAPDPDDGVIYSVARDVTDDKLAQEERDRLVAELQSALAEVRTLQDILPICSYCRKIRDDEDYWHTVEGYISRHTSSRFSHGICPQCMETVVEPQLRAIDG